MRRLIAFAATLMLSAVPALADPPADDPQPTTAKMRKVCHPAASSNPLYPEMKCHMVPVAYATPAHPTDPAAQAAAAQIALDNGSVPR